MLSFVEEHDYYTAKIGSCQSLFYLFSTFLLFCFFLHHKGPTWAKSSRNAETFPVEEGTALCVISFYLQTRCYRLMLVHHRKRQHANDFPILYQHILLFSFRPFFPRRHHSPLLHEKQNFCTKTHLGRRMHACGFFLLYAIIAGQDLCFLNKRRECS